jgi:ubiquinone/menaquinone biosynthesis C-methylase UbiE
VNDLGRYLLNNQQAEAGERFDALAKLFNPSTFRHIKECGLAEGWNVWEVGAGGPSIPTWLAQGVGPTGKVIATDIDTSWLDKVEDRRYEVLRHDVAADAPPGAAFDLVHARLVLVHVIDRDRAIANMVKALRPGGWLILEEADPELQGMACPDEFGPEQELANKLKRAFRSLMAERGVDLSFGRTLPRRLRNAGLVEIQSDAYFPVGGPVCNELERATLEQIRGRLVDSGLATQQEIDQHLANVASGLLEIATSPMISAWAHKPLSSP